MLKSKRWLSGKGYDVMQWTKAWFVSRQKRLYFDPLKNEDQWQLDISQQLNSQNKFHLQTQKKPTRRV